MDYKTLIFAFINVVNDDYNFSKQRKLWYILYIIHIYPWDKILTEASDKLVWIQAIY